MLTPLAESRGLDYETESLAPSYSEAARAYGFVACGADLLLGLTNPDEFPSLDRRTKKRGANAVIDAAGSPGAGQAAIFLAQAMAMDLEWLTKRAGLDDPAGYHRGFRELIQRVYPLDRAELGRLDSLAGEFRVMETHEVPERGIHTGYHQALVDPGHSEFDNVDDDAHLVETQQRYAGDYLRNWANVHAVEMIVGEERFAKLEANLLIPATTAFGVLEYRLKAATRWTSVAEDWARHAVGVLAPEPKFEPLPDDVAEFLRRRTTVILDDKWELPEYLALVFKTYADMHGSREPDWNCLTEALMYGYCLRRAEEDLTEHQTLDRKLAKHLRGIVQKDAAGTFTHSATQLVPTLAAFFSRGEEAWYGLRSWGSRRVLEWSQGRRERELEPNELPSVGVADCSQAFDYGYAVRTVETTIYGEDP